MDMEVIRDSSCDEQSNIGSIVDRGCYQIGSDGMVIKVFDDGWKEDSGDGERQGEIRIDDVKQIELIVQECIVNSQI